MDYWDSIELVCPSLARATGKGHHREYSYLDLVKLGVVIALRKAGLPLQRIRKALKIFRDWDPERDSLAKRRLVTDGTDLFVMTSDREVLRSILKRGQLAFGVVLLGDVVEQAEKAIHLCRKGAASHAGKSSRRREKARA